jgi:osmotically inducible lipoprotein OsmB
MNASISRAVLAASLAIAFATTGCSTMNKGTVAGAGIGGVTGALVTNGSPTGAAVGAVVGGVVGNEVDKRNRK